MPFVSRKELDKLYSENGDLQNQVVALKHEVTTEKDVSKVADEIRDELSHYGETLVPDAAMIAARVAVTESMKASMVAEARDELLNQHREQVEEQWKIENGQKVRQEVDEELRKFGVYDQITRNTELEVRAGIAQDLKAAHETSERERLAQSEEQRVLIDEEKAKLVESGLAAEISETIRTELQEEWEEVALVELKEEVDDEEGARRAEFVEATKEEMKTSDELAKYRQDVRAELEALWKELTLEELKEHAKTEEEKAIIAERIAAIAAENEAHDSEQLRKELQDAFEGIGYDVSLIKQGAKVRLRLGEHKKNVVINAAQRDRYGGVTKAEERGPKNFVDRTFELVALGEGRFSVISDSLYANTSEEVSHYRNTLIQNDAIQPGTIIKIGSVIKEDGQEKFDQKLTSDRPFYYDIDSTDDVVVNAHGNLIQVVIDGVAARNCVWESRA